MIIFTRRLVGSFYSPTVYRAARMPQSGMYLFYSFLLVLFTSGVLTIAALSFLSNQLLTPRNGNPPLLDQLVLSQAAQIPVMILQDGTLNVKAPQPYPLRIAVSHTPDATEPDKDFTWAVIDTTGATTMNNMTAPILVTAHEIYVKSKRDTRVYSLDSFSKKSRAPLIINRAMADDTAKRVLTWLHGNSWKIALLLGVPGWLMFTLVAYLLRIVMLMAIAIVSLITGRLLKLPMDYATSMRHTAIAYTPIAILAMLSMLITGGSLSSLTLFCLGCGLSILTLFVTRKTV